MQLARLIVVPVVVAGWLLATAASGGEALASPAAARGPRLFAVASSLAAPAVQPEPPGLLDSDPRRLVPSRCQRDRGPEVSAPPVVRSRSSGGRPEPPPPRIRLPLRLGGADDDAHTPVSH